MTKTWLAVLLAIVGVAACSDDPPRPPHETIAELDETPLAILAHGDTVVVASKAELASIEDTSRSLVRITDGRYRECPWNPWKTWDDPLGVAPRITPDGSALVLTAWGCGAWAWPLTGGVVTPIARASTDYREWSTDEKPVWDHMSVPSVRDGDGWIACGQEQANIGPSGNAVWSLAGDGSPKERLARLGGYECEWLEATPDAVFAATDDFLARIDRKTKEVVTLVKSESYNALRIAGSTSTHFLVLHEKRIDLLPKDGGPPQTVVTTEAVYGCGYACFSATLDTSHVYWTDGRSLTRAPIADLTKREELVPASDQSRIFATSSRRPSLALTSNAVWALMLQGETVESRRPILARIPKPSP